MHGVEGQNLRLCKDPGLWMSISHCQESAGAGGSGSHHSSQLPPWCSHYSSGFQWSDLCGQGRMGSSIVPCEIIICPVKMSGEESRNVGRANLEMWLGCHEALKSSTYSDSGRPQVLGIDVPRRSTVTRAPVCIVVLGQSQCGSTFVILHPRIGLLPEKEYHGSLPTSQSGFHQRCVTSMVDVRDPSSSLVQQFHECTCALPWQPETCHRSRVDLDGQTACPPLYSCSMYVTRAVSFKTQCETNQVFLFVGSSISCL